MSRKRSNWFGVTATWLLLFAAHAEAAVADLEPRAVAVLLEASRSDDALLRMHAVEGAAAMPERALPMVQLALEDANPAVRFAAWVTTGKLRLVSLAGRAESAAANVAEPDYVQAAAIFAAHRCGRQADLGRLASMLYSDDPRLRSNAALLFGLMDDTPAAVVVLTDAAETPLLRSEPVERELFRLQLAEALVNLGQTESLKALRGAAYSNENEVRVLAVMMLGRADDRGMRGNLTNFLARDPVELRLAAAEALARMGFLDGLPVMLAASESPSATLRVQAAFALGQASADAEAAARLAALLEDPLPRVRVAAAASALAAIHD
ncbi:MAG: HEAT repeat domain-containing protein [Planctomycetota bacterium]